MAANDKNQQMPPAPPAPPVEPAAPAFTLDDIKQAVRESIQEALAEIPVTEPAVETPPVDVELTQRTIRHNMFSYDLPGGGNAVAMRGDTVGLLPHDVERGERHEAFTARVGDLPTPTGSLLPDYPDDDEADAAEQDAWVKAATVEEIIAAVNTSPGIAASVLAAEERRGDDARKTLLASLGEYVAQGATR